MMLHSEMLGNMQLCLTAETACAALGHASKVQVNQVDHRCWTYNFLRQCSVKNSSDPTYVPCRCNTFASHVAPLHANWSHLMSSLQCTLHCNMFHLYLCSFDHCSTFQCMNLQNQEKQSCCKLPRRAVRSANYSSKQIVQKVHQCRRKVCIACEFA